MARDILVTGGATGIGLAVARHFAESGEKVVVTGRRQAPLEAAAAEIGARALVCDHTDPRAVARLQGELPDRLDVLVNNAGGNTDFDAEADEALGELEAFARDFRANLDANLLSAALTTRAVEGRLAAGGAVVSIGSIAADKGSGAYGAAKAGLASWNLGLARQVGARDITANLVAPGYIADTEFFRDKLTAERRDALVAATALGRPGAPGDIAGAVAFLASPAARDITAQVLHVNGGERGTR
ncbi:SDR family NAD(P)-dependent oxidoreductase [Streptomyces reniochalinae]|uniref:SDR family NAD(P)-dependent oxidoreductase n=1 Tax=Streptomyces reniochalinae TaxID=2250578 RepID=A0A367EEM8_9ACTN|nr:SDR family oxidoreductase [Streptomyces reniochalinae]RCG16524.1 SDR family NAD(P)-dependent oxidoreductase [Streptomyces reniochalinae]